MDVIPEELKLTGDSELSIRWNDGETRLYSFRELRDNCPCASCREKRTEATEPATELPILSIAETAPLKITTMQPVGAYAYSIQFSDGHDSGIYRLEFLHELGKVIS